MNSYGVIDTCDVERRRSEDDEMMTFKSKMIPTTSKKTIKIEDLLRLIEMEKKIISPQFNLAGVVLSLHIYSNGAPGFVGIYLSNDSHHDAFTSIYVR